MPETGPAARRLRPLREGQQTAAATTALVRRAGAGARGPLRQGQLGGLLLGAAVVGERHLISGLLALHGRDEVVRAVDLLVVQADDEIAADTQALGRLRV